MKADKIDVREGEGDIMTLAVYNRQHNKSIREMQEYVNAFKKLDKTQAEKKARESLIRSGVLNEDGTSKKQICG